MTREELINFVASMKDAVVDDPFCDGTPVFRNVKTKKWFGIILTAYGKEGVNLKCDPVLAQFLRGQYESVLPAYHMNKTHWNTVYFDGDVPREEVLAMVEHSFQLTCPKEKQKCKTK